MHAKYLLRFDDICSTMDWVAWEKIEHALLKYKVRPILAVVPDNQDPKLVYSKDNKNFWKKIQSLQSLGFTIAIHGYQHKYETDDAGIVGLNNMSEFAGLSKEIQEEKIEKALNIFEDNGIKVRVWVAPSHSFDRNTIKILKKRDIELISDGYYLRPVKYLGATWIPQQIWKFRYFPFGIWTVCLHHNGMNDRDISALVRNIIAFNRHIINLDDIDCDKVSSKNFIDHVFSKVWLKFIKLKRWVKYYRGR